MAQDQQVNLPSLKDNTLYEDDFGTLSNGAGQHMFVGTTNRGLLRRALIAFDIAGNIPAGATIQSVVLTLNMSQTNAPAMDIDLRAATQDWGEGTSIALEGGEGQGATATSGDATWIHTFWDTQFWNAQGGDYVSTPSATTTVGFTGAYAWSGAGMMSDVQGWLDQPSTNFGWVLVAPNSEHVMGYAKRFDTKENLDPTLQPVLSVTYTPPLQASMVNIPSLKDNTLYEESGMLSNGAGPHMFVGTIDMDTVRRALIAFDIAANIPAGSMVQGAVLTLNMDQTTGVAIDVDLWPVAQDWGEGTSVGEGQGAPATPGDATWIHTFFDTQFWNLAGGDFVDSLSATTTVDQAGVYTWSSAAMVSDVQGWLDQPANNFGWGLVATNSEHVVLSAKRLGTKENSDPIAEPVLTVTYLPAQ
jgi:hypothetical protein